jgi:hypothetical protein
MPKSQSIKEITKALITFQVKVDTIKKDAKNPFFKSTYASLANILDSIKEPLIECGLAVTQFPYGENGLMTILMHESGEWIGFEYQMRPAKDDPQGRGSAITYQRRYAIASVLCLNIDEDDDGNLATHGKSTPDEKQWLDKNTPAFVSAMEYIRGGGSIDKIKAKYKLNKEIESLLTFKK